MAVGEEEELRPVDAGREREPVDGRGQKRRLGKRQLAGAERSEDDPRAVPVQRRGHEEGHDEEEARQADAAEPPAERRQERDEAAEQERRLAEVHPGAKRGAHR